MDQLCGLAELLLPQLELGEVGIGWQTLSFSDLFPS